MSSFFAFYTCCAQKLLAAGKQFPHLRARSIFLTHMSLEITIKIISRLWARNSARLFAELVSVTCVLTKFTSGFLLLRAHTIAWVSREMNVRRNAAMKQTLAMLFVTALLLFSLAGCGEKKDSNTANGPSTSTTDNGAADSGKKKDNLPGDDMSGENKKDDSVTGDGMMGDDMDGDGENTTRSVDRRNAAASASDRSRYFGSDKTITHENGNLYGKTYLNPETEKSANAQLRSNGRSLTGTNINGISNDVRYRQMLSNGRVHDTDGFLFDGENTHYNTLK